MAQNDNLSDLSALLNPKNIDRFMGDRNKNIVHRFSGIIKENFLSKMCDEITRDSDFKKLIDNGVYNDSLNPTSPIREDFRYDIAVNVAAIHWYWTLPISNDQHAVASKYDDRDYIIKLKRKAIEQCSCRLLLNEYKRDLLYSHFPIIFSMHCLISVSLKQLDDFLKKVKVINGVVESFDYSFALQSLQTIDSILLLIENNHFNDSYALLRTLIEKLFTYCAINGNESAIKEYSQLLDYRLSFEATGELPEEYKQKYPDNWKNPNFINYGWLKILDPERKDFKYVFKEVIDYSQIEAAKKEKDIWLNMYKRCSNFSHGAFIITYNQIVTLLELVSYTSATLINVASAYCKKFNTNITYNDEDLVEKLDGERSTLATISSEYMKMVNKNSQ